jgi:hypothetical protein
LNEMETLSLRKDQESEWRGFLSHLAIQNVFK